MSAPTDPRQLILRPLVTEKSLKTTERRNAYAFAVDMRANKVQVRRAVEELFDVTVVAVQTDVRKGKPRRTARGVAKSPSWKRSIVALKAGDTIQTY